MKIAIVWNHPSRLLDCSFRFEQYVAGFEALGHAPVVVCRREHAEGFEAPLHLVESDAALRDPSTWRELGAEAAVIVTWHRMPDVLAALREAGTRVLALTDTDGKIGFRAHPWASLEHMWVYASTWREKARCVKYWLGRLARERLGPSPEDREVLESTRLSDVVAFGSRRAREEFRLLLRLRGEEALEGRLAVVPFTIGASFLSCPVPTEKARRIVAIGRWDDPQKHPELLVAALERVFAKRSDVEVEIFGRGGEEVFAALERHGEFRYRGVRRQEIVAEALSTSRAIVFSSRWEGCPHSALEALTLGATLVGTRLPSLESWVEGGRFGRVAASRAADLSAALLEEMAAWDAGERDPRAIAEHWRAIVAPEAVCRQLLAALERA